MIEKLLTVKEVSDALRMSKSGTLNLIRRGTLRCVVIPGPTPKRPGRILVKEDELEQFIERHVQRF